MSLVLACDLGGTSFRAALVDEAGHICASHTIIMPVPVERLGWSEIDPALWWMALQDCAAALFAAQGPLFGRIGAIAISAITRSQVFTGHDGKVLRPAILWRDTRADVVLDDLRRLSPDRHPESLNLSAFHPLARLCWLKHREVENYRRLAHVLEPKDYLHLRLTGIAAGDTISMARLVASAAPGPCGQSLFEAAGLDPSVIPRLKAPVSVMGHVQAGLPGAMGRLAGLPVIAMANDTWASVIGLGAMRPGLGYNLSGTTEVLGVISDRQAAAEGLLSVDWSGTGEAGGNWQLGGPSQTGGDTLVWLLDLLARFDGNPQMTGAELDALLSLPRQDDPVLFLPYLQGERVPYWDPSLRGAFLGLNRRHGPGDLAWAVLEGIALLNRVVLERAEAATGSRISELRFGGGGAANEHWRQVKADVLDRTIACVAGEEHGIMGAAIVAWTALARFANLEQAQDALVRVEKRYLPRPEKRAGHDRLYRLFGEAEQALNPVSRQLAGWHRTSESNADA